MNLFTPLVIKNKILKNRVVLPPLVRFSMIGKDGFVTDSLLKWYFDVANGGTGLIIVEACCVAENGKLRDNQIGIWDDKFISGLSKIADIGKRFKVPMLLQIHHAGFKENISTVSEKTLDKILIQFVEAIKRAKICGFDGIELHCAHTYLISQLHSKLWNTRCDKYGGNLEKRLYFVKKIIEETHELFNNDFLLGCRIGGNEPTLQDGIDIALYLENLGVDIIHVSTGVPDINIKQEMKINLPNDCNLDWVVYMGTEIKKYVNIPVIGVRNIRTEKLASSLIENRQLDLVAIGRAMIARPNWVEYAKKQYIKRTGKTL